MSDEHSRTEKIDKKALKRQYLEVKTRAGVYLIRNLVTERLLIAGSNNVTAALNRHRFEMKMGSHRNLKMRADWKAHGEDSFTFEVLDALKYRDDPGFNAETELEDLVALWRGEISFRAENDYEYKGD